MLGQITQFILFCGILCQCTASAHASELHQKTRQLHKVQRQIHKAKNRLKRDESKRTTMLAALRATDVKINKYQHKITTLAALKKRSQKHLWKVQQQSKKLTKRLHKQQTLLAAQVRSAYQVGNQDQIKLLLNQENVNKTQRLLIYYGYFNRARIHAIDDLQLTLQEVASTKSIMANETKTLYAISQKRKVALNKLKNARARNKNIIKQLDQKIVSDSERIQTLKNNQRNLERLLKALHRSNKRTQALANAFARQKHKLPWPTSGIVSRTNFAKTLQKNAVFIAAAQGTSVRSVHAGKVIFANWLRGFGLLIILEHDDGFMTLYAHNDSLHRKTNDYVSAGELIASVGNSGGNLQSGLYFEIRHHGKALDPHDWCA